LVVVVWTRRYFVGHGEYVKCRRARFRLLLVVRMLIAWLLFVVSNGRLVLLL
jgi:hypothetical protein